MTLRQLEIFLVVARRLSLRAAGEELRIAQPSISYQLRLLEEELGTKLHIRRGRGMALTPAGTLLLRDTQDIFSRIKNLKLNLKDRLHDAVPASLTVGGSLAVCSTCLPSLLARFKRTHQRVQLNIRTDDGVVLARMVLTGEIDLAVVHNSPAYRQILREPFHIDPVIACVSRKHPLAAKKYLTVEDMQKFGFVIRRLDDWKRSERFIDTLKRRGFDARVVMECDSPEAKKMAVRNQIGIGLIFKSMVDDDLESGELIELELPGGRLYGKSYIIHHKNKALSAPAQDFIELLRQYRAQLQSRSKPKRHRELFKVQGSRFNVPPPNSELKTRPRSI